MKVLDNRTETVRDDLLKEIKKGSKVSVAAACFSIYAYRELKKQLESVDEFRCIYTSPTFIHEQEEKQRREFFIPRHNREIGLYGTEFELRLRNEMTQKAIARECAEWIRKKARFRSNTGAQSMNSGFIAVETKESSVVYQSINEFTTVSLGCEQDNSMGDLITVLDAPYTEKFIRQFDALRHDSARMQDVTDIIIGHIETAYRENAPEFIYFLTLYHVFSEFLDDISEDVLPNEATGFKQSKVWSMLYDFQRDAVLSIINKLEKYNGCILADSVGLGKTFTALAVIKYYENRNKSVLVLCPKKLAGNWNTYKDNYVNNPLAPDRLNYTVLFHTDLGRESGESNGIDLGRLNWGNYDLVVIDESHNFRNGIGTHVNQRENRYQRLMEKVIRAGVRTKVLMLSATPVNNRFSDLKNQLAIAYEGESENLSRKLNTTKSVDEIFKQAQSAFSSWSKLDAPMRTTQELLRRLDFDFFELLDSVTIARSRKHVERFYNTQAIGKFPERLPPISLQPKLTDIDNAINYSEIYEQLNELTLCVYTPSNYIFPSKLEKYSGQGRDGGRNLTQTGRELGIQRLMSINLLKRLESSVHSFRMTLMRIRELIASTLGEIDRFERCGTSVFEVREPDEDEWDIDDENAGAYTVGRKVRINLADMDVVSWKRELSRDMETLDLLLVMVADITPEHDMKLQKLLTLIEQKIQNPINPDNRKILIFSAFSDTAEYLYEHVSRHIKQRFGMESAVITGSVDGRTTIRGFSATLNNVLTCFAPLAKGRDALMKTGAADIDVLIATDCISEGQNLQDCDYLINYDIHWNPVRIIQRFGRVDRIGSRNERIQLVNFWPDITLDEYIKLKARVQTRMKLTVLTATGDDDLINIEEKGDLQYRKEQLRRMQEEIVDMEDMTQGISIMDLGLNEFRLDLLEYIKTHGDLRMKPCGLHAVAAAANGAQPGVIFVLRNRQGAVNVNKQNRLHPFYMVYLDMEGNVVCDHLSSKELLDHMRLLCRGHAEPDAQLCQAFNRETADGRDMSRYSALLGSAIESIVSVKGESELDSFLSGKTMSFLSNTIEGLDDFELISFLVIR